MTARMDARRRPAYRLAVAGRVVLAVVGGYAVAALLTALLALTLPLVRSEAVATATLLSFAVMVAVVVYVFAARTLGHAAFDGRRPRGIPRRRAVARGRVLRGRCRMRAGFRQSMAWLHAWSGLVVGWVLFAVFVTGTASYYRSEISQWMRPELSRPRADPGPLRRPRRGLPAEGDARMPAAGTSICPSPRSR